MLSAAWGYTFRLSGREQLSTVDTGNHGSTCISRVRLSLTLERSVDGSHTWS